MNGFVERQNKSLLRCSLWNIFKSFVFSIQTQILRPFTLAFTVSKPDGHGMRINVNIGDLCFNVAPKSIEIIQKSVQVQSISNAVLKSIFG